MGHFPVITGFKLKIKWLGALCLVILMHYFSYFNAVQWFYYSVAVFQSVQRTAASIAICWYWGLVHLPLMTGFKVRRKINDLGPSFYLF